MAIEGLFDLIGDFIYDRAFDKEKSLKRRLPYIIFLCFNTNTNTNINYCLFNYRWYLFN